MPPDLRISPLQARRLFIHCQRLDGGLVPAATTEVAMLALIQQLGCLQIDPINVVARSPLLVLWSRLGIYDVAVLQHLLWTEKALFEYWAHAASIVLTENYPLHQMQMRRFAQGNSKWDQRVRAWMAENEPFRQYILEILDQNGPLPPSELEDRSVRPWRSTGWTAGRNVSTMLGFLWEQGDITVALREGNGFGLKKNWALTSRHLPQWTTHAPLSEAEVVGRAAEVSLRALGVATAEQIKRHFVRGFYPGLGQCMAHLEKDGRVCRVQIVEEGRIWPGTWYVHRDNLALLERLQIGERNNEPVFTTLLSPFDNLICDRERTEQLFNFAYRSEIYVPKARRQYGYYVMPILHGDRLIGRLDPRFERQKGTLHINAVHLEPDVKADTATGHAVAGAVAELGAFLAARQIRYGPQMPAAWQPILA